MEVKDHRVDMENVKDARRKILLTGTCWYELTGLWHLLSAYGYNVFRKLPGDFCHVDNPDLTIVALSAEPVAGWGRHLSWIRILRKKIPGKMLVLVPGRLENLKILRNICSVYSGAGELSCMVGFVHMMLTRKSEHVGRFRLTQGQRHALKILSERGRDRPLNLKNDERSLYWHYAQLAANVGVRDFRMLLMTGLDREICEMEDRMYGKQLCVS